jgi:flagellar hook-associated protein 2
VRISGFYSGLDIDQMVKDLMTAQRKPLNRLTQQKTTLEWQREQYREITTRMVDFRNNKLHNYSLQNSINSKKVNISGNTTAVNAKANAGSASGTLSIEVVNLATADTMKSTKVFDDGIDTSKTLKELKDTGMINYTLNNGKALITTGGTAIELDPESDTLSSMISKINSNKDANVNAYLDGKTGIMSITSKQVGGGSAINLSGDILDSFNLALVEEGKDADVIINGITTTRSSNKFTENGIDITLLAKSEGQATQINVVSDTDKTIDTIKSFIKDYNELLDLVNKKLNEEKHRKFPPLTAEQRKEMKEDEIKLWEEKARSGLLKGDSTLSQMVTNMRLTAITDVTINGQKVNLTSLGISTGDWTSRGKLVIQDEDKLRQAIESNPEQVAGLFTQYKAETDQSKAATNPDNGLFNRLSNILMTGLEGISEKAGTSKYSTDLNAVFMANSTIGDQLKDIDLRMDSMNLRLSMIEARYYKQFTAMESAMSRYAAQSSSMFANQ